LTKLTRLAAIAAISMAATDAGAQSTNQLFQTAINEAGRSCSAVTATTAVGTTSAGNAIIAVACSGGEQYVVEITASQALNFISTCATFEGVSGTKCF